MSVDVLLSRLEQVRQTGPGKWQARCPAHPDRSPSLAIREEADGLLLVHDFGGCSTLDVINAVGLDWPDLFPEKPPPLHARKPIKKPWRPSDVIRALGFELDVAWIILADVSKGKPISDVDRERAADCVARIQHFIQELEHAH